MSKKVTVLMLGFKSLIGKDTFFSFIQDMGFVRCAYADKLKNTVADLYNFSHEQMHGNLKDVEDYRYPNLIDPEWVVAQLAPGSRQDGFIIPPKIKNPDFKPFLTPRRVLQIFGQQQRALFQDIWASYIFNVEIPKLVAAGQDKIVVTDFRFRNEAAVAQNWALNNKDIANLSLIKINRSDVIAKSGPGDISENDLNDFSGWDHVVENDGSLSNYKSKVLTLVNEIITKQS